MSEGFAKKLSNMQLRESFNFGRNIEILHFA